ncbi:RNA-binding protein [Helicobacter cinaedi]|uniref:RRM domain-containing protein n=1 Tax=Helicobacter cinaedi CCUG 18818 = ATCC BAA-847 TaxID=537971 RepID=A0ABN0B9W2_9HELI|nr:hypothetical protein HCCG_00919 [Helicobacter cinaedi CCUG 18818 = ATCC BAA-847]QOQ90044.1 RNA-binding protein [Helicobacter cinaedi]QOQ96226.1 RNA-binding protein [Helicobacter cinaedi]
MRILLYLGVPLKTLYVGNLVYAVTQDELRELFSQFGEVFSVKLINDRESGRPKGFGFVEMEDNAALKAIEALNEKDFRGRNLRVNEARPRE